MIKQVIRLSYFMIHDTLCPFLLICIALRNSHICVLICYIHSGSVIIIYSRHHKLRHRRPPSRQTSWLLAQPPSWYTSLLPHPLLAKPNDVQEERRLSNAASMKSRQTSSQRRVATAPYRRCNTSYF